MRSKFKANDTCHARLLAVAKRQLENHDLILLRIEFEVFAAIGPAFDDGSALQRLESAGKIVCRDVVLGKGINVKADSGLWAYVESLKVEEPERVDAWLELCRRPTESRPWVKIIFGSVHNSDMRNTFASIRPFDPAGYKVVEFDVDLDKGWVIPKEAARRLKVSESTIRRRLEELEPEFGSTLVWRTEGQHRRIYVSLLRNLLDA